MRDFGRISVCGSISTYNDVTPTMAPACESMFVFKQLKMEGFLVGRWTSRWMEGLTQMSKWIQEVSSNKLVSKFGINLLHFLNREKSSTERRTLTASKKCPKLSLKCLLVVTLAKQ